MISTIINLANEAATLQDIKNLIAQIDQECDRLLASPQEAYDFIRQIESSMFAATRRIAGDEDLILVQKCIDRNDSKIARAM